MKIQRTIFKRQSGFSMIELLVALTIGFIVVAGVGYMYLGGRQTYRMQDSLSTVQENSRFALDVMSRDIRMAGYIGCGNLSSIAVNNITQNPQVATPNASRGLQIFAAGSGWAAPAGVTRAVGDVLRVQYATSSGVTLTGNMGVANANIQIGGNPAGFQAGDVLMVSDCQSADVFVANNVSSGSGTVTIAHSNSVNSSGFLSKAYGLTPPPAQVYSFRQIDYFVGCPTASWTAASSSCSRPLALYQSINSGTTVQALVDNVENLAFNLGMAAGPTTGVVASYQTSAAVQAANTWANVNSVELHLLMVGGPASDTGSNVAVVSQPYTFNGTTSATSDRRMHQEAIATVAIRNRVQ